MSKEKPKGSFEELTDYLYVVLNCQETQTKAIIKKFLAYIQLYDKKQHD